MSDVGFASWHAGSALPKSNRCGRDNRPTPIKSTARLSVRFAPKATAVLRCRKFATTAVLGQAVSRLAPGLTLPKRQSLQRLFVLSDQSQWIIEPIKKSL